MVSMTYCSCVLKILSIATIYCKDDLPNFLIGIWQICKKTFFSMFWKKNGMMGKFFRTRASSGAAKNFGGSNSNICALPKFFFEKGTIFQDLACIWRKSWPKLGWLQFLLFCRSAPKSSLHARAPTMFSFLNGPIKALIFGEPYLK